MSYSRYRQQYQKDLLSGSVRTNGLILASFYIPPGKTIIVYGMRAYMSTAGTAATTITLNQDGGATLATVTTHTSTGHKNWDATAPLVITGAASTGSRLQLTQNTTDVLGVGTLLLDMEQAFI